MEPDIVPNSRFLPTTHAFYAPVRGGGSCRNIAMAFGMGKLESDGEKSMTIRLRVLTEFTNVTDGHTDRHRMTAKTRNTLCRTRSLSNATFSFLIT